MKILLVEDSPTIVKALKYTLEQNGYETTVCDTYDEAVSQAAKDYDLLLLDVGLADGNGFELCEDVKRFSKTPVIFLTARDDEDSIVRGFDLGADDYITKPFMPRELLARIRRVTRQKEEHEVVTAGDIQVDLTSKIVKKAGATVELTALEYRIFSMLAQNQGQTVTRELILEKIWDLAGNYVNDNTLTVYIKRIRQKLDTKMIKTVKGMGYRLEEE